MIPVRSGSQRVPGKGLMPIGGTTLVEQAISLALTKFPPHDVFLNTNWDKLKPLADKYSISFFRRQEDLCSPTSTNDEFMFDFLSSVDCDRVIQLLPTSPYLSSDEFSAFSINLFQLAIGP